MINTIEYPLDGSVVLSVYEDDGETLVKKVTIEPETDPNEVHDTIVKFFV